MIFAKGKIIFVDPVSIGKAKAIKKLIGKIHTLKMNKMEAEFLSETKINDRADLDKACVFFLGQGIKRVFITLGSDGVYFSTVEKKGSFIPQAAEIKNATGAGDAFMAGIIYSHINGFELEKAARFGSSTAIAALSSEETVNPELELEYILRMTGENFSD